MLLRGPSSAMLSVAFALVCAVAGPVSAQPDDVVDTEETQTPASEDSDPADDSGGTYGSGVEDRDRPLDRPARERRPPQPDAVQLPPPEDGNPWLTYAALCGTRCVGPPVISHLVAPFLASWAGVGFIDSSEHYSTETKLASGLILLFTDVTVMAWLSVLLSPAFGVILVVALLTLGSALAVPVAVGAFVAMVLVVSAAALFATPALPTYYMVTSKRRDLDYYHQRAQRPDPLPSSSPLAVRY